MIQLEHISKRYVGPSGTVDALKDVSVHVEKGDISTSWKNRIPAQSPWLAGN